MHHTGFLIDTSVSLTGRAACCGVLLLKPPVLDLLDAVTIDRDGVQSLTALQRPGLWCQQAVQCEKGMPGGCAVELLGLVRAQACSAAMQNAASVKALLHRAGPLVFFSGRCLGGAGALFLLLLDELLPQVLLLAQPLLHGQPHPSSACRLATDTHQYSASLVVAEWTAGASKAPTQSTV